MSLYSKYVFYVIIASAAFSVFSEVPVLGQELLRWKLSEGQQFDVEMEQKIKQAMTIGGRDIEMTNDVGLFMTWAVEKIDESKLVHMSQTINRLTMSVSGPMKIKLDTDEKKDREGSEALIYGIVGPMVGVKITQLMTDRGEIKDIEFPKEALSGVKANPLLQQMFSKDGLKDMMQKAAPVFPEAAINKGHSWKSAAEVKTPAGKMAIANIYEYLGAIQKDGRTLEKIGIDSKLEFKGDNPFGATIKIVEQDNKGAILFDAANGYSSGSQLTQKIKMEIEAGGQKINQNLETTIQMKLTPKK